MEDVYKNIQLGYNKIKNNINVGRRHYEYLSKRVVEQLSRQINNELINVLDAGCGNGYLLNEIQNKACEAFDKRKVDLKFYGFDISNEMVDESKKTNQAVDHRVLTLPDTDYDDGFFDVVVIGEVLEHLYQPRASLMELRRILKEDGDLIVTVPNGDRVGIDKVISYKKKFQPADDVLLTYPELNYLFRRAGFRIVEMRGYGGVFPILSKYSRMKKYLLLFLGWIYKMHPNINRLQKQIFFVLKKDDYLLGTDY